MNRMLAALTLSMVVAAPLAGAQQSADALTAKRSEEHTSELQSH